MSGLVGLKGKTALITGASRGIGRAVAIFLAKQGVNIALVYAGNDEAAAEALNEINTLKQGGVNAEAYKCDVSSFTETLVLSKKVIETFGGVDILVNNAGIVKDGLLLSMKEEDFDKVIDVNLKGAFNMTKHFYQQFMRKKSGRIINITSVVGIMGNAGQANYSAAKAGLIGLTKTTAKELASRSVTCNAIAPGFIISDMTDALSDKVKENVEQAIPLKKMGRPDDIAALVGFLASDFGGYITGEVIKVDGGMCM